MAPSCALMPRGRARSRRPDKGGQKSLPLCRRARYWGVLWEGWGGDLPMMYAVLCYNDEKTVWPWSKQEEEAVMARLEGVRTRLAKAGKMGPTLRLLPTTAATTLRKTQDPPLVIDGPFAETKEQLLGFYVIDV